MIKKWISGFLCLLLLGTAAVPAAAASEEGLDSRLTSVTLAVKETLGIGDEYTTFYGDYWTQGTTRYWQLRWESEEEFLSVLADDAGKVYSYNLSLKDEAYERERTPAFPSVSRAEAEKCAKAFINRVMGAGESVSLKEQTVLSPYEKNYYHFSGILQISGLDTPIGVNLSVRVPELYVSSFSRDDTYRVYIGEVPSSKPAVASAQAAKKLTETLKLELRYVLSGQGDDEKRAVLRYVPVYTGSYVVDAKNGELINVDTLYGVGAYERNGIGGAGDASAEAPAALDKAKLSEQELEGIKKLEGVFTQEQLDAAVRELKAIGVTSSFVLGSVNYDLDHKTGEVTAHLSYWSQSANDGAAAPEKDGADTTSIYKYVSMNAKTGKLKSLSTYYSGLVGEEGGSDGKAADLPASVDAFLKEWNGTEYALTSLYSAVRSTEGLVVRDNYLLARKANGYFFPDDQIYVSVNKDTGIIEALSMSWTDNVVFEDGKGILSEKTALQKYTQAFRTKLHYADLPVAVDPSDPGLIPYAKMGHRYVYRTALVYSLDSGEGVLGIDAKTGAVVRPEKANDREITYSDISGTYARSMVEELARYGIGYYGGRFLPQALLTQRDMILLLVSINGYYFDPENLDEEYLYSVAYGLGILDKGERNPEAKVTRAQMVKTLVKMSGYGIAAELPGIYICGFSDDSSIPAELYGYMAIGKGLGIIEGYADNTVRPNQVTTRLEAAVMLYHFMDRNR